MPVPPRSLIAVGALKPVAVDVEQYVVLADQLMAELGIEVTTRLRA